MHPARQVMPALRPVHNLSFFQAGDACNACMQGVRGHWLPASR
jgi:hypothetical protein